MELIGTFFNTMTGLTRSRATHDQGSGRDVKRLKRASQAIEDIEESDGDMMLTDTSRKSDEYGMYGYQSSKRDMSARKTGVFDTRFQSTSRARPVVEGKPRKLGSSSFRVMNSLQNSQPGMAAARPLEAQRNAVYDKTVSQIEYERPLNGHGRTKKRKLSEDSDSLQHITPPRDTSRTDALRQSSGRVGGSYIRDSFQLGERSPSNARAASAFDPKIPTSGAKVSMEHNLSFTKSRKSSSSYSRHSDRPERLGPPSSVLDIKRTPRQESRDHVDLTLEGTHDQASQRRLPQRLSTANSLPGININAGLSTITMTTAREDPAILHSGRTLAERREMQERREFMAETPVLGGRKPMLRHAPLENRSVEEDASGHNDWPLQNETSAQLTMARVSHSEQDPLRQMKHSNVMQTATKVKSQSAVDNLRSKHALHTNVMDMQAKTLRDDDDMDPLAGDTTIHSKLVSKERRSERSHRKAPRKLLLRFFASSAYSSDHKNLRLVWNDRRKAFLICIGDEPQQMRGRDDLVQLGINAVRSCTWYYATDDAKVLWIQADGDGSAVFDSIYLIFDTAVYAEQCRNILAQVLEINISLQPTKKVQIDDTYRNLHSRFWPVHASRSTADLAPGSDTENDRAQRQQSHRSERHRSSNQDDQGAERDLPNKQVGHASRTYASTGDRRSTRATRHSSSQKAEPSPVRIEAWTKVNSPEPWTHSVVYPLEGPRRITIDFQDLERLDEGEFLNDTLISYALRRIEGTMSPQAHASVHFFNTYFYSTLTTLNGRKGFNYDAVSKWTRHTDLFAMPYVVVPVNSDLHWYAAIICNLPKLEGITADNPEPTSSQSMLINPEECLNDDEVDQKMEDLSLSERRQDQNIEVPDSQEARDADNLNITSATRSPASKSIKRGKRGPPPRKYRKDQPSILTLDSFGNAHTAEVGHLKTYLQHEAAAKRDILINREELKGITIKNLPQQDNYCDCGLFLIAYLEAFGRNPQGFVEKALSHELDVEIDFLNFDPSAKRAELRESLLRLYEEQETARQEKKKQRLAARKAKEQSPPSSPPQTTSGGPDEVPSHPLPIPGEDLSGVQRIHAHTMSATDATVPASAVEGSRPAYDALTVHTDDEFGMEQIPPLAYTSAV